MNNNVKGFLSCVGVAALIPLICIPLALLQGWVLACLWTWFIAPIFGLPAITMVQACGISLIGGMFCSTTTSSKDEEPSFKPLLILLIKPLATLAVGYVFHVFM